MDKYLHIVTVGTSIIRNAAYHAKSIDILKNYSDLLSRWARSIPESAEDVEAGKNAVPGSPVFQALLGFISSVPRGSSAELNAFFSYLEILERTGKQGLHDLFLLSSDSGAGWLCTRLLEEYLKSLTSASLENVLGIKNQKIGSVKSIRVGMLGRDFHKGLLNLLSSIKNILLNTRSKYDYILANLTAGFKPESGMLLIASSLLGIDKVYYIHEFMKEVVELPIIPMAIRDDAKHILYKVVENIELTSTDIDILKRIGIVEPSGRITQWTSSKSLFLPKEHA